MIEDKKSISDTIYHYLFDSILSMQMKPGEKISEEKVAKIFGVSRAPVRDALKMLSNDGIVNIYPRRFAEVANYSDEQIRQLGIVRIFHELIAIKLCTLYGSKIEYMKMQSLCDQCYEAAKANDLALRIKKDCEFHLEFSKISKNQQLIKFAEELYTRIEFYQACKGSVLEDPAQQHKQHCDIIEALLNGREDEAKIALVKHNSYFHDLTNVFTLDFFLTM